MRRPIDDQLAPGEFVFDKKLQLLRIRCATPRAATDAKVIGCHELGSDEADVCGTGSRCVGTSCFSLSGRTVMSKHRPMSALSFVNGQKLRNSATDATFPRFEL